MVSVASFPGPAQIFVLCMQYGIFRSRARRESLRMRLWYVFVPILPYLCAMQYFHICRFMKPLWLSPAA